MSKRTRAWDDYLKEQLQDPEFMAAYLEEHSKDIGAFYVPGVRLLVDAVKQCIAALREKVEK